MTHVRRHLSILVILGASGWAADALAQEWELVWSDEFDGDELDESKWSYQYGTGASEGLTGWGNNELQYYTDREENVYVKDGKLHIVAREESYNNRSYTSGRIRTINKGDWTYGRFEIRAKLPEGQGLWPAIWMMPTESVYGGWAASGEIDIMEYLGHEPDVVHGTLHYGGGWPNNRHSGASFKLNEGKFSDDFHTFTLQWMEGEMRWYVDDVYYQNQNSWYSNGNPFPAPFDQDFHMILNVAVGGNWPGRPDASTVFPQEMVVDYVRVYQRAGGTSTEPEEAGQSFLLEQNYPNPFGPVTNIRFEIPHTSEVSLTVYDVMGREVANLADGFYGPGTHVVQFDGANLASGFYTYRLQTGIETHARNMLLVR